jgi:hypothetical protein
VTRYIIHCKIYVVFDLQEDERPCKLFISIIDEHPMDVITGKLKSSFGSTDNSRRLQKCYTDG